MPSWNPKLITLNKVLPMSADKSVTHVPGLDPHLAVTKGSGLVDRNGVNGHR
jgi:hypothetical protein